MGHTHTHTHIHIHTHTQSNKYINKSAVKSDIARVMDGMHDTTNGTPINMGIMMGRILRVLQGHEIRCVCMFMCTCMCVYAYVCMGDA
jgi:hypothetical protein